MNRILMVLGVAAVLGITGCKKADAPEAAAETGAETVTDSSAAGDAPAPESAAPADPAVSEAQAKLDYATMEDGLLNDANGQWASAATASWADGEAHKPEVAPDAYGSPMTATGTPDGKYWILTQNRPGFDWLEASFDKPVSATEVRVAFMNGEGVEAINRIELIDIVGTAHVVWSGLSDAKQDKRGARTWFVRKFGATPYQTQKVKITIANNVQDGYKHVDAVQLVGG